MKRFCLQPLCLLVLTWAGTLPSFAQTNLSAWHTNGQTWLIWTDTQPQPAPQTYDLYVRSTPSTNLALWTPIGRVLQQDWQARRLRNYTPATQWQIPTAGGPSYRLASNEGLFVHTPHAAATQYFAVVRHGQVALTTNNVVGPIAQPLTQPVTCHPQLSDTNTYTGQSYTDYAFWLDGRADWTNSRPDIPVLGNASFNGVASLFRIYQPIVGQTPGAKLPTVLFAHGRDRSWRDLVPGESGSANLPLGLTNGLLVTLDDGVWAFDTNVNQVVQEFTFWFGYWEGFDRFAASESNRPPSGALVVDFTVRKNMWLLDWLIANHSADSNRVAWMGTSMGAGGGGINVRAHPERFSSATVFVPMVHPAILGLFGAMLGSVEQNLPTPLGLGVNDLFYPTNSTAPDNLPPMRFVWGVNDPSVDWNSVEFGQKTNVVPTLAASRLGFVTYWDERVHVPQNWAGHWAGPDNTAIDGSPFLTAQFLTRYRNDQSFPAFSNDAHPDTNVFQAVPFCSTCTNWGTRNGYFDWDVATIADTATNWAVTVWMHSTNTTSFSNDVPAFATATTDVTIRRAQQFKPAAGAPLIWTYTSNNVVIASGTTSADANGLVTVTNLTLYKDPARTRLEVTFPPASRIHVVTVNADGSFSPARVEIFDGETVEWRFTNRRDTIIPVNFNVAGNLCTNYLPYNPADPNEFTGPMPRAVSGIFALSPEDTPYAVQDVTWQSTNITGVFIRMRWDSVHLGTNQFYWDEMDAEIQKAVANGKVYSLGFKAGSHGTPQWMFYATNTDAVVPALDFGFRESGQTVFTGSPANANFRKHFSDLLRAAAAHLRERNAWYRALAYIKISGANLHTHENRLQRETTADQALWASAGQYTPTALYQFYDEQSVLLAAEFPDKDMSYALIQDGFPLVNDSGEYLGQPAPLTNALPTGAAQTERIMDQGRTNFGTRFVVQHNGLQPKPAICPNEGIHPIVLDPNFHYVGSGCPNRWVLEQASLGQVTGFQIVAGISNLTDLESTFSNQWDNSDGIFLEIYQGNALSAVANGLPSGKTLGDWADQFHQRRRTAWPGIPDPFPLTHRHTFARTAATNSGPQLLHFINGSNCSTNFGVVAILPDLSFTAIVRNPDGSVQLTLGVARAGTLRVEYSDDLIGWTLLESRITPAGTVEVTDTSATVSSKFYRAILLGP